MFHIHDGRKRIALTIDDGPSPEYTPRVLRLLEKYRVTATFSMIGLEAAAHPGLVREVAAAGHKIANHTWSHLDLVYLSPAAVADQMGRATGAIHKATGRVPALFRAPYGAWSPVVLRQCAQAGMTPHDWSVDPRDWSRPGVAAIVGNIMRNTRAGSIILEHDGGGDRSSCSNREPSAQVAGPWPASRTSTGGLPVSAVVLVPVSAAMLVPVSAVLLAPVLVAVSAVVLIALPPPNPASPP